jgi:hypothetical protein
MTKEMIEKPIYEKLESETQKAYEAFCIYRDMGLSRSIERVRQQLGVAATRLEKWSCTHDWVKRADAYDTDQEAIARQILEEENREAYREKLRKYRQENEEIGNALRATAVIVLKKFRTFANDLDPKDIKPSNSANIVRAIDTCLTQGDRLLSDSLAIEKLLQQMSSDEED